MADFNKKIKNINRQIEYIASNFLLKSLIRHFPELSNIELNNNKHSIENALSYFNKILGHVLDVVLFVKLVIYVLFHYVVVILAQQLEEPEGVSQKLTWKFSFLFASVVLLQLQDHLIRFNSRVFFVVIIELDCSQAVEYYLIDILEYPIFTILFKLIQKFQLADRMPTLQ